MGKLFLRGIHATKKWTFVALIFTCSQLLVSSASIYNGKTGAKIANDSNSAKIHKNKNNEQLATSRLLSYTNNVIPGISSSPFHTLDNSSVIQDFSKESLSLNLSLFKFENNSKKFNLESSRKYSTELTRENVTPITHVSERLRRSLIEYNSRYPHPVPIHSTPPPPQNQPLNPNYDYLNHPGPSLPPEQESFNYFRYHRPPRQRSQRPVKRPRPSFRPRRPIPSHGVINRGFPIPRPRPIPIPLPLPGFGPRNIGHSNPSYSYPRQAANIQDILSYFQKEENNSPSYRPQQSQSYRSPDLNSVSMGGDFSRELRDVQSSLLKDIRQFAQRPNLMSTTTPKALPPLRIPPMKSSSSPYSKKLPSRGEVDDEEEEEDIFRQKAKPVRDMIKDHPIPLPRPSVREKVKGRIRDESHEIERPIYKSKSRIQGHEHEDKDVSDENELHDHRNRERVREKSERHQNYYDRQRDDDFVKSLRLIRNEESDEIDHTSDTIGRERVRKKHRPKHLYSKGKYRESGESRSQEDDNRNRYQNHRYENDYDRRDDRRASTHSTYSSATSTSPSHYHQTHSLPIVIKKPYGVYKSVSEAVEPMEMQRKSQYWNSREKERDHDFPSSPSKAEYKWHRYASPTSSSSATSEVEDIVEIHTDARPYRPTTVRTTVDLRDHEREERDRKNQIHKLYLEYLERRLAAETLAAVAASTVSSPYTPHSQSLPQMVTRKAAPTPMRMKIHIYPNENTDMSSSVGSEPDYNYHPHRRAPPMVSSYSHKPQPSPPRKLLPYVNHNQRMHSYSDMNRQPGGGRGYNLPPRFTQGNNVASEMKTDGPSTAIDKNKNLVLHLHVHRRNDEMDDLLTSASEIHITTVKPVTHKNIYDQVQEHQNQQRSEYIDASSDPGNKSGSMEVPVQEEKIEDVLHSFLKFKRQKRRT